MWEKHPDVERFIMYLLVLLMSLLGALASYANRVLAGEQFRWTTLVLQAIVSIFAGSLVVMIAVLFDWEPELAGGISGLAGWSGAGFIKALEERLLSRVRGNNGDK